MALIIADSDVLIDALRGREPSLTQVRGGLDSGSLATTTITVFELLSGVRSEQEQEPIRKLLAPLAILPFDEEAASAAAVARRQLESQGTPIGMGDLLIAGICLSRSAALLTRNRAHFDRVPGLQVGGN